MRPFSSTYPRWQSPRERKTFCSTRRMVSPPALMRWRSSKMLRTTTGARPRLGSSSMSSRGLAMRPAADRAHLLLAAREGPRQLPLPLRSRGKSSNTHAIVSACLRSPRASARRASRFSFTVMVGKSWRASGTWAMPRATTCEDARPSTRSPANSMRPARSGKSPEMARRVVVFPAPLLPIRATVSPSRTSSEASCTAVMSP